MGYFGNINEKDLEERLKNTGVNWDNIEKDRGIKRSGGFDLRSNLSNVILELKAKRKSDEDWPDEVHNIVEDVRSELVYNNSDIKNLASDTKFWSDVEVNNWEIIFYLEKRV